MERLSQGRISIVFVTVAVCVFLLVAVCVFLLVLVFAVTIAVVFVFFLALTRIVAFAVGTFFMMMFDFCFFFRKYGFSRKV